METVRTRAPESIVFGHKSPEKPPKSRKKSVQICLGARCRRFKSWTLAGSLFRRSAPYTPTKEKDRLIKGTVFLYGQVPVLDVCSANTSPGRLQARYSVASLLTLRPKKLYHFDTAFFIQGADLVYHLAYGEYIISRLSCISSRFSVYCTAT